MSAVVSHQVHGGRARRVRLYQQLGRDLTGNLNLSLNHLKIKETETALKLKKEKVTHYLMNNTKLIRASVPCRNPDTLWIFPHLIVLQCLLVLIMLVFHSFSLRTPQNSWIYIRIKGGNLLGNL